LLESGTFCQNVLTIEHLFQLRRRYVADGSEESPVVEPVHPLESCVFHVVEVVPGASLSDDFGLVETDDGFGESVVVGIPS